MTACPAYVDRPRRAAHDPSMRVLLAPIAALALAAVAALAGCGAPLEEGGPLIDVAVCATAGTQACAIDLYGVPVSADTRIVIDVANPGDEPLEIATVIVEGDPSFAILERPAVIAPRTSRELIISVRPSSVSSPSATLVITSNATNASRVEIAVGVASINAGLADVVLSRSTCVFEDVVRGTAVAQCDVTLANVGVRDLIVDRVFIEGCDESCAFRLNAPIAPDTALAPGTAAVLTISFSPSAVGTFEATLVVETNDPDEPRTEIALSARATP